MAHKNLIVIITAVDPHDIREDACNSPELLLQRHKLYNFFINDDNKYIPFYYARP